MKKIAYFISSHGYGHGVRSAVFMNAIPKNISVTIYSDLNATFFEEEMKRDYELISCTIDCGCLQKDSVTVEVHKTLITYQNISQNRESIIKYYSKELVEKKINIIIGDIPPLCFAIAKRANIPAFGLSNFNWVDIYEPFLKIYPEFVEMIKQMKTDYQMANHHYLQFPGMKSGSWIEQEEIGLISRQGKNRRQEIGRKYGMDPNKNWCLVYIGNFGILDIHWENLSEFIDWEFYGVYPLPKAASNYHLIQKDSHLKYADLTASCDVVLGKLGYGLLSECLSFAKPVIYMHRDGFAEFFKLKEMVLERKMGLEVSLEKLKRMDIGIELLQLKSKKLKEYPNSGVKKAFEAIFHLN